MEQEENRSGKKGQEKDKKYELSPFEEEKMQKKSNQETASKENSSRLTVFERYGTDTNDASKCSNQSGGCAVNGPTTSNTIKEYSNIPLESANR